MNPKQGLLCGLTDTKAAFTGECDDFLLDTSAKKIEPFAPTVSEEMRSGGVKEMVFGGLVCLAGIIATAADFGYIFYGAILGGGILFFRGAAQRF